MESHTLCEARAIASWTTYALTSAAERLIAITLGEISALEWQGALLTGRLGSFQLHFWCTITSEILVSVSFEQSQPRRVEIHD